MRLSFSLRTLLVAITFLAVGAGAARMYALSICAEADRHDLAIKRLEGLGLEHDLMYPFETGPKRSPLVRFARKWIHPHAYPQAHFMVFGDQGGCMQFGSWTWKQLREELPELKHVIGLQSITGKIESLSLEEAKHFGAMRSLQRITLTVTGEIEHGALAEFARGPHLRDLKLFAQIDKSLIEAIRDNQSITTIQINGARMTPELMKILCESRSIESLSISNLGADAEMLGSLKNLTTLTDLRLYESEFTAGGINQLVGLPLKKLSLGSDSELPTTVAVFAVMKNLEELDIYAECPRTKGDTLSFAASVHLRRLCLPHFEVDSKTLCALNGNATLRYASFYGEAPEIEAQAFADGGAGRWLFVTRKPPRPQADPLKITLDSWPTMYVGKNCGELAKVFPNDD